MDKMVIPGIVESKIGLSEKTKQNKTNKDVCRDVTSRRPILLATGKQYFIS